MRQINWADGLKVFRRRICPPSFLETAKSHLLVLPVIHYILWSRSGGGTAPIFCAKGIIISLNQSV
jgi:hypothetical protein